MPDTDTNGLAPHRVPRARILIVDDDANNLDMLGSLLRPQYMVLAAPSGERALRIAAGAAKPDLILLDVLMPGMDGYEVFVRLRDNPATSDIPVIFVTGLDSTEDEEHGLELGAVDYIAKPYRPPVVLARVRTHLSLVRATRLEKSYRDAIFMLGEAGHFNDTDTGVHIWRMAAYARTLAAAADWSEEDSQLLELAAPMHDTGKLGIPDAILRKPGKLDAAEWEIMKTHARIGHDILVKSDAPVFVLAAEVALHHHEKWDGSGYPDGLAGTAIPEAARIVALADVFDALTMKRPYKEAWPIERVVATLRESAGGHFEPRLVELFLSILPQIRDIGKTWESVESAKL